MRTAEFLTYLHNLDIKVWADGESLRYSAPPRGMSAEVRRELSDRKADILAFLRQAPGVRAAATAMPLAARDQELPLSPAQERFWVLDQLGSETGLYNVSQMLRLSGPLEIAALERSLAELVARHESLRTTFPAVGGRPVQVLAPPAPLDLPVIDLSGLDPDAQDAAVRQHAQSDAWQRFDLARGPLLRVRLLALAPDQHVLLLTLHHIICDAWSMGVLNQELAALYTAHTAGQPACLPPLPVQYPDYAVWQRAWLAGPRQEALLAYWQRQLSGAPPLLALPTDRPRPPLPSTRGAIFSFLIAPALEQALRELSRQAGCTLFMTLLAGFQLLLARYSGQDDIVVGMPIANRPRREVEGLIGLFMNLVALRTDLGGNPSVRELLGRVREVALEAYAHQELPFATLVEALQPERTLSYSPLVQVVFDFHNTAGASLALAGLEATPLALEGGLARYDLSVVLRETDAGLAGGIEYNADLFDAATIARLAAHYQALLAEMAADSARHLGELPLLSAQERHELLVARNATAAPYPAEVCYHHLVAAQVARTPQALAVRDSRSRLSYAQLDARANRLAQLLVQRGVTTDSCVALLLERSCELLVAVLAVLKAGAAFLPLDRAFPPERLAFMLDDAQVPLVLTHTALADRLPAGTAVLCLDQLGSLLDTLPATAPSCPVTAAHRAYLIYTSGSTGRPKGVPVPHRGLVNYLHWAIDAYTATSGRGAPVQSSLAADAIFPSLFTPLLVGGSVLLLPEEEALDALALALDPAQPFSLIKITPTQLEVLSARLTPEQVAGSVHTLVIGAEALRGDTLAFWQQHAPTTRLLNEYGPTETVVGCSAYVVPPGRTIHGPVPIGLPIANTQFYVLDRLMQPVPVGVVGELYIGGDGVAYGYHNRPEQTAAAFVPDPFSSTPGARLYKTGDQVRYLPDAEANIEFLGRADEQVKIRGYRVELGEVEAVLASHPLVAEVAVLARNDDGRDMRLVAYVVGEQGRTPSAEELRTFARQRLPEYMLPAAVVGLEQLPLTATGKLDRRALPAPELARPEQAEAYVAPRTAAEELLAGIWADVLGLDRVGVHDNFFTLGGHSLLAMRIIAQVQPTFRAEVPLRSLFETPTVAGLAEQITAALRKSAGEQPLPIEPVGREMPLALSFAQERLWMLDQLESAYHVPFAMRLSGPLEIAALERSLAELVARHESLRTTFPAVGGRPAQVLAPPAPLDLPVIDLSGLDPDAQDAAVRQHAQSDAWQRFDLARGPLLRVRLLALAPQEHMLLLTLHHIICDAWSMGVLNQELAALYTAHTTGQPACLPPLPVQYPDYAVWQRAWLAGPRQEALLAYWQRQLSGAPPLLALPTDRPRPPLPSTRGAICSFDLAPGLVQGLQELSRQAGCTLFMTLLAGFQLLLARYSGQDDIVVGTPIANRPRREVEGLIGLFMNLVALRTDLGGNPSVRELLGRVREVALEAYAHQELPFATLVEALQPERTLSYSPLVQVVFDLHNTPGAPLAFPGLQVTPIPLAQTQARYDLLVVFEENGQGLRGEIEYATDLFDTATVARLAAHYQTLLAGMVADPARRLAELPLLSARERRELLVARNATAAPYPADACIHDLVAAQAERTPEAIAVSFEGTQLTYDQLNKRANQLAHSLIARGVGPGARVGICVHRSPEMVIGLLGVLKAGAAYLPLDPAYPAERVAFMLDDSRASALITQSDIAERLPGGAARRVLLDAEAGALAAESTADPAAAVSGEALAYIIYTSGSTGRPKGVQIPHRAVVNFLQSMRRQPGLAAHDLLVSITTLAFDIAALELFLPLTTGARLLLASRAVAVDGVRLAHLLDESGATCVQATPATWRLLLEAGWQGSPRLKILCGGEALPRDLANLLAARCGELWNMYGPTETTIWSAIGRVERGDGPVSIGYPIANTQIYILDPHMQPVPSGVAGELFIGGDGLAHGYWMRPELTAERFVPNPFRDERRTTNDEIGGGANEPSSFGGRRSTNEDAVGDGSLSSFVLGPSSARLYRTGDLARYRSDGAIEYLGRSDHQIKLRGYRIELGEIEAVLAQHPAVRTSVALVREDTPGDQRLVAYVVPAQEPSAENQEPPVDAAGSRFLVLGSQGLRAFLKDRLPEYMLPAIFVVLDALPLTPNGKVDRRALPAPAGDRSASREAFVAPRTAVEELLADIWAEVLQSDQIGVHDNFFALGGHSLLAMQTIGRIRSALHLDLSLRTLFESQTIAELSQAIHLQEPTPGRAEKIARALLRIRHMSPDEIRAQLRQREAAAVAGR